MTLKNGEKYTSQRIMQIRTLKAECLFNTDTLILCSVSVCACVCVFKWGRKGGKSAGKEEHRPHTGDRC